MAKRYDPQEFGQYNISKKVVAEARRRRLHFISTGGGLDYVFRKIGVNEDGSDRQVILTSYAGHGGPDTLRERAVLMIMLNESWDDSVSIHVPTAKDGMIGMTKMGSDNQEGYSVSSQSSP